LLVYFWFSNLSLKTNHVQEKIVEEKRPHFFIIPMVSKSMSEKYVATKNKQTLEINKKNFLIMLEKSLAKIFLEQ
jgi:hypothetical protein